MKSKRAKKVTANLRTSVARKENHCPVPDGILMAIGGKENKGQDQPENKKKPGDFIKLEVLQKFRELIGKRDPLIELITTSTSDPSGALEDYKKVFAELDVHQVHQIHHNDRAEILKDPLVERVKKADAFFYTGGDQLKLTSIYGGTRFLTALKERYIDDKIVIAGTSAGAMALSTPMIYAGNEEVQELSGEIKVTTGLEFLKDVCVDTHFVHRGRFVRMAQVIVTNPTCIGLGIEEDTAVIVRNGVEMEVIGTGLVVIMEGFEVTGVNIDEFSEDKPLRLRDLRVHMLSSGDQYQIPQLNPPHK